MNCITLSLCLKSSSDFRSHVEWIQRSSLCRAHPDLAPESPRHPCSARGVLPRLSFLVAPSLPDLPIRTLPTLSLSYAAAFLPVTQFHFLHSTHHFLKLLIDLFTCLLTRPLLPRTHTACNLLEERGAVRVPCWILAADGDSPRKGKRRYAFCLPLGVSVFRRQGTLIPEKEDLSFVPERVA